METVVLKSFTVTQRLISMIVKFSSKQTPQAMMFLVKLTERSTRSMSRQQKIAAQRQRFGINVPAGTNLKAVYSTAIGKTTSQQKGGLRGSALWIIMRGS